MQLHDLQVREIKLDEDGETDCEVCGDPMGTFNSNYILNDDATYLVCSRCGAIYKVKE